MTDAQKQAARERMMRAREVMLENRAKRGGSAVLDRDPTKEMSQEERIGRTKQKLSESERRGLREQVEAAEEELRARKELSSASDVSDLTEQIKHKKMILQHDDDLTPKSDTERDRLMLRNRQIEAILKKEMPTRNEMWPKHGSIEAQRALRHNVKFQAERGDLCREWQENQRKLEPDDPNAASLENIRPD